MAKVPRQMRLISKSGFRRDIRHRAPLVCREQFLGVPEPTTQQVLVRRQADDLVEEPAEMERAQTCGARHFIAGELRAVVCLDQGDRPPDGVVLRFRVSGQGKPRIDLRSHGDYHGVRKAFKIRFCRR